jgi:hypothetical protein
MFKKDDDKEGSNVPKGFEKFLRRKTENKEAQKSASSSKDEDNKDKTDKKEKEAE